MPTKTNPVLPQQRAARLSAGMSIAIIGTLPQELRTAIDNLASENGAIIISEEPSLELPLPPPEIIQKPKEVPLTRKEKARKKRREALKMKSAIQCRPASHVAHRATNQNRYFQRGRMSGRR